MRTSPSPKKGRSPQFSSHVYCGQKAAWIKMMFGTEVGLGPDDTVLDKDPAPPLQKGVDPLANFRPMSIVAKQLDGSRWHLAWRWALVQATLCYRWGPSSPPKKGAIFGPFLLWPNGCMHQVATWYGGRPQSRRLCVRRGHSYPQKKGTPTPTQFWPMSIVAKRLDG